MRGKLLAFLEQFEGDKVTWGVDDCCAMCAAWVRECGYELSLPSYSSQEEADALIERAGGLVALWDKHLSSVLYERVSEHPRLGDVGIIPTRRFGPTGVIWVDTGLCAWRIGPRPSLMAPRTYLRAWAVS